MQIAGTNCAKCGTKIGFVTDGVACAACRKTFHKGCLDDPEICPLCMRHFDATRPEKISESLRDSHVSSGIRVYAWIIGILALIAGVVGGYDNLVMITSSLGKASDYAQNPTNLGRAFHDYHSDVARGATLVFVLELMLIFVGIACLIVASGKATWQRKATMSCTVAGLYSFILGCQVWPFMVIAPLLLGSAFAVRRRGRGQARTRIGHGKT